MPSYSKKGMFSFLHLQMKAAQDHVEKKANIMNGSTSDLPTSQSKVITNSRGQTIRISFKEPVSSEVVVEEVVRYRS